MTPFLSADVSDHPVESDAVVSLRPRLRALLCFLFCGESSKIHDPRKQTLPHEICADAGELDYLALKVTILVPNVSKQLRRADMHASNLNPA